MKVRATVTTAGYKRGQTYDVNGRDKQVRRLLRAEWLVKVART